MRQTSIDKLECKRLRQYDPDYHPILELDGGGSLELVHKAAALVSLKFKWKMHIRELDSKIEHGIIEGEATITVTDETIPSPTEGKSDPSKLPENVIAVLEGGIADDVLLPISVVARSMKLPNLLLSPISLRQQKE